MALKVIGTGFGRTGTDSMRKALNILGAGPTHHMLELGEDSPVLKPWQALVAGAAPDWDVLFNGYRACVDWPSAHYWRQLVKAFPNAKVLLTMRSAESWWESFEATILQHILSKQHPDGFAQKLVAEQVFEGRPDDKSHAIANLTHSRHSLSAPSVRLGCKSTRKQTLQILLEQDESRLQRIFE